MANSSNSTVSVVAKGQTNQLQTFAVCEATIMEEKIEMEPLLESLRVFEPPVELSALTLPDGEWVVRTQEGLVRISGHEIRDVFQQAEALKIDLTVDILEQVFEEKFDLVMSSGW